MAHKTLMRLEQMKEQVTSDFKFVGTSSRRLIEFDVDEKIVLGDNTGGATAGVQIDGIPSGAYVGIGNDNLLKAGAGIADDDFIRVNGTVMEGRSAAEVLSDIGAQPLDAELTELATMASNTAAALADLSNVEVALLDGASASNNAASKAVILDGNQDIVLNSKNIHGLAAPTAGTDAVNRDYVDARAAGLDPKESVYVATTANVAGTYNNGAGTITAGSNGAIGNIDGESIGGGERILVRAQTDAKQNGIYVVTTVGDGGNPYVLTRASDADASVEMSQGVFVFVVAGTTYGSNGFLMSHNNASSENATLGTDNITWTIFTGAGSFTWGDGLAATGNTIAVDLAADSGLEFSSNELRLKIADDSLERDSSNAGVSVKLKAAAGLVIQGGGVGLKVDLAGSDVEGVTRFSGKTEKQTIVHSGSAIAADGNFAIADSGQWIRTEFEAAVEKDREIYLNGMLLLEGANAGANNDWYEKSAGVLAFEFPIEAGDVITMVYRKV